MPERSSAACVGCSCVGLVGLALAGYALVTLFSSGISPESQEYTDKVQRWELSERAAFETAQLVICIATGTAATRNETDKHCVQANGRSRKVEGTDLYSAYYLETDNKLLPDFTFDLGEYLWVQVCSGRASQEPDCSSAQWWKLSIWVYYSDTHRTTEQSCDNFRGLWLDGDKQCLQVAMLSGVCMTVKPRGSGKGWRVARSYGHTGVGCAPTWRNLRIPQCCVLPTPCRRQTARCDNSQWLATLGDWPHGRYIQANGTAIHAKQKHQQSTRPVGEPPGQTAPARQVPTSSYKGNFADVRVRLRSVEDPLLYALANGQPLRKMLHPDHEHYGAGGWAALCTGVVLIIIPVVYVIFTLSSGGRRGGEHRRSLGYGTYH